MKSWVRGVTLSALRIGDGILGGGRFREALLLALLRVHYSSRFRVQWRWTEPDRAPHFFDHRIGFFDLGFGAAEGGPYPYSRAFLAAQVIRPGDHLLDLGCGDGFFTRRFFAKRCAHVDGVDVDPCAIAIARRDNAGPNVAYHLLDATTGPWPRARYDVVVWDGALGHFDASTTDTMMRRIVSAIGENGIFVGSESLGREGQDHLQFFETLEELRQILSRHFKYVQIREERYSGLARGFDRREAMWRCAQLRERLTALDWALAERPAALP